jgi:hypothetical protein
MLHYIAAKRMIVTVSGPWGSNKIFQIFFSKKDGSLFVNFPYFKESQGIVSELECPPGIKENINLHYHEKGKVTSHKVKYSHHPDGTVLFSQDGKVYSHIRKKSLELDKTIGHIFTVMVQEPTHFAAHDKSETSSDKHFLNFELTEKPEAIRVVALWYRASDLKLRPNFAGANLIDHDLGPIVPLETEDGERGFGFLLSNPYVYPPQNYLILRVLEMPYFTEDKAPSLGFIGGFDSKKQINDFSQPTSFLALNYPIKDFETLKKTIGSIDYLKELR